MSNKELFIEKLVNMGWMWGETDVNNNLYVKLKNGKTVEVDRDAWEHAPIDALVQKIGSYDVEHICRVVGYFSKVHNWNPSKLGELAERREGKYGVEESHQKSQTLEDKSKSHDTVSTCDKKSDAPGS